ncbi:MAG TPA: tRNA uridine-5-carboxymethylaminomethyl(34) synthesis GTPase MnmE, partial [Sulfitobacter sp.]|nr:tRNA uridine-5-carboxymethylaminomethyl(34) synthesis GTPase MnmE [Sulfitobacter sp.]
MDTIFAQASAPGRAGVAVIRISGPRAFAIAEKITGKRPKGRESALRNLRGAEGEVIDQALMLSFPGPNSFTGEDVVELQVHGSIAVVRAMLSLLATLPETRMAEAG